MVPSITENTKFRYLLKVFFIVGVLYLSRIKYEICQRNKCQLGGPFGPINISMVNILVLILFETIR